jgi:hypothetical protein
LLLGSRRRRIRRRTRRTRRTRREKKKDNKSSKQNPWEFARKYRLRTSMYAHTDANVLEFQRPSSWDSFTEDQFYICFEDLHVNNNMKQFQNLRIACENCMNVDMDACFVQPPFIHNCYILTLWYCEIVILIHWYIRYIDAWTIL